jgi:hypothetical protein
LVKHKGCHPKYAIWVKPSHLDHWLDMVIKFEQERGHELGVKRTRKKKRILEETTQPQITSSVDEGINPFKVGENV